MYWNNPKIEIVYPSNLDPIADSLHSGRHALFYDPAVPVDSILYEQTLSVLSDWANRLVQSQGIDGFVQDPRNHYDIANLVKLNLWVHDIRAQGIVKPMLLKPDANPGYYRSNTGESRCRVLERIPEINTVTAFITCHQDQSDQYAHLVSVTKFEQFVALCNGTVGQEFIFTLTDDKADHGLYWFEYNSDLTRAVTPHESYCVSVLHHYLQRHTHMQFSPEWFDNKIDWNSYE